MTSEQIHIGNMSHETAIGILKLMLEAMETYDGISSTPARINAFKMAIEALEQEPTTKNDLGVEHHKQNIQAYAHDFGVSEEQAEKELRVTTKNDLGVDCISRKAALDITWHDPSYSDPLNVLTEVRDKIRELPSVTPQEPFKPMVEIDLYSVIKQKYIERDVLDKIRAEILNKIHHILDGKPIIELKEVLQILDKYKAETEAE